MSEKPFGNKNYYKREIYYKYNADGQMLSETECECIGNARCDFVPKKEYVYNQTKELDKKISYTWRDDALEVIENNRN